MSWEQEDSLRRKVREARERQAFKDSIESVLTAKDAQAALLARREVEQDRVRQDRVDHERQRREQAEREKAEQQQSMPRIIGHLREGRPERER
jgi:hypothetical protein